MSKEKIVAYLQRFTGTHTGSADAVRLTSVQKAAFASWMRREAINFAPAVLQRGTFSIATLLGSDVAGSVTAPSLPMRSMPSQAPSSRLRIGIDLEQIASLPDAVDYREHEFYRDNFTPKEIAYCLQRPDTKASLCGLWAAKEAILKVCGIERSASGLRAIEILHDDDGQPRCDSGELSISHSGGFCIAVYAALAR